MTIPESDVPARLALAVGRINRRLRASGGDLSQGLLSALATVAKSGPIRLAELAQRERISAPSITRLVFDLEAQGLVTRSVDPSDGRAFLIVVTDAGTAALQSARSARAETMRELLAQLGDEAQPVIDALPALERMAEEQS